MSELEETKYKLSTAAKILRWELANMWGHVSVRMAGGDRFLLLPLRPPFDTALEPDEFLEYDLEGKLLSGRRDQPDELFFYTCPYRARKDVSAVIHCHPEMTVALTAAGKRIFPIHLHSRTFSPSVPVTPWLYGFWPKDGEEANRKMGRNYAVIIQGHGAIVTGPTIEEACTNMVRLERTAKLMLLAGQKGKLRPLSSAASKQMQAVAAERPAKRGVHVQRGVPIEWRYYESMIKKGERWSRL